MFCPTFPLPQGRKPRTGSAGILLIVLFLVTMLVFAWVYNVGVTLAVYGQMERSADASALGATLELVNDAHLKGFLYQDVTGLDAAYFQEARDRAKALATLNIIDGQPFTLDENLPNDPDGEIVFGKMDHPGATFIPSDFVTPATLDQEKIDTNAVRIRVLKLQSKGNQLKLLLAGLTTRENQDLAAKATAMMDRDVIGFRHLYDPPIPLAPLALLGDFSGAPRADSWQKQIEGPGPTGPDDYSFTGPGFILGMDGLREFSAKVAFSSGTEGSGNVKLLYIGTPDVSKINEQIETGVTKAHLSAFGKDFKLDPFDNELIVPGEPFVPLANQNDFLTRLIVLRDSGAIRIFPLYSTYNGTTDEAKVRGFVAARIVAIDNSVDPVVVTFQPTMISTSTALTNFSQRNSGGISILNKYISKVRLVD